MELYQSVGKCTGFITPNFESFSISLFSLGNKGIATAAEPIKQRV